MSSRLPILAVLLALLTTVPATSGTATHGPGGLVDVVDAPRMSAHVTVAGPSVYRQFAATARYEPRTEAVVALAEARGTELAAAEASVMRRQDPVVAAAGALGIRVVSRYTTAANGLLVHATADQLAALRRVPGVILIEPAPITRPALTHSAPHTGAARLEAEIGYDGTDSVVAIIDTGVDYTHAHLGGPGTAAAWQAAAVVGATETITDTWNGVPLFPNDKVIGGWDFVGRDYEPPHICTPAREAAGDCTSTPEPDPDPLDGAAHGTHVAGIVAGQGAERIGDGVAPGAKLVGLKLYGRGGADEAADVLVDAIEWCAKVNLGLEDRGVLPPRVDAINISLGEVQAQGSRLFDEAVEAAVGAGIVVVVSAGNEGNRPFVVNSPSTVAKILSVASAIPPSSVLDVEAMWGDERVLYEGDESVIARPLAETGRVEADLAWFGLGCAGEPVHQDPAGKLALVARGDCTFSEKLLAAQAADALGVVMFTNNRSRSSMSGDGTGIEVPAAMIDREPGEELVALLEGGTAVRAALDPANTRLDMSMADRVSSFSSRGPSRTGALKPDITGPGSSIVSTGRGSGDGPTTMSGTSMSGPHVAGAAAVVHQRNRWKASA